MERGHRRYCRDTGQLGAGIRSPHLLAQGVGGRCALYVGDMSAIAASCVAIEDSHWGLQAARQAGLRAIAVTHTYPASALTSADLIVERLSDLTFSRVERIMGDNGRVG